MCKPILFSTVLLLTTVSAWAETPIDETRPLAADGRLHVSNVSGIISVQGWSRNEVEITGMLGEGVEKLEISGDKNSLDVLVRNPNKRRDIGETTLTIKVPSGAGLDLEGVSADIIVSAVKGKLAATTVSGDVRLKVESEQVAGRTVSGDIELVAPSRDTKLYTVSGDVDASGLQGRVALETVSGDADLTGAGPFSDLQLKSISGDITVKGAFTADARVVGETLSGDLLVKTAAPVSAALTVNTFSGAFNNRLASTASSSGPKGRHEIKLGDGKARIDLSSFSGDVTLSGP